MKRKQEGGIQREEEEEVVEVKQRSVSNYGGDGVAWFRHSLIGRGSFGPVYLAISKKPHSSYSCFPAVMAVKSAEVSVSGSIQKEREVLSNIGNCPNIIGWCPHIIGCYGEEITMGENGEMVYNLLLEYGSGGTLADLIKKSGGCGLPSYDARYYAKSILLGLNHIHQSGYVHCDLKPENILLVTNNTGSGAKFKVKIGDLGLTKRAKQSNKNPYLRGTPMYLSPEVFIDGIQEAPSDIWAFGCIVLEMLTGKSPWVGKEDLDAEALLSLIGEGGESPKIPNEISREGKEFLKGCFSRKAMFRLTAEMLLFHPFIEGIVVHDDDEVEEEEDVFDADVVDDSSLILHKSDEEWGYSSFSDEDGFDSEEFSSFDEDRMWEGQHNTDIVIAPALNEVIVASKQFPTNTMLQPPMSFTIPAGV